MVKLGPKQAPLSRRELDRLERERKRNAQLENGGNGAIHGEPMEVLVQLQSQSKRTRSRRLDHSALEEAMRRREKNRLRLQARKLAKKRLLEASNEAGDSRSNIVPDVTLDGTAICDGEQTIENALTDSSVLSFQLDCERLGTSVAHHAHGGHHLEDHLQNESSSLASNNATGALSPLSPNSLQCGAGPNAAPEPPVSKPHLDVEIVTDPFWGDKKILSASSSNLVAEATQPAAIPKSPAQLAPNLQKAHAIARTVAGSRIPVARPARSVETSPNSSRVHARKGSEKSVTFSKHLDLPKDKVATNFESSFDNLEEYMAVSNQWHADRRSAATRGKQRKLSGSSLSSGSMISGSSNAVSTSQGALEVSCMSKPDTDLKSLGHGNALVPAVTLDACEPTTKASNPSTPLKGAVKEATRPLSSSAKRTPNDSPAGPKLTGTNNLSENIVRPRIPRTRPTRKIYPHPDLEAPVKPEEVSENRPTVDHGTTLAIVNHPLHISPAAQADDGGFSSNRPVPKEEIVSATVGRSTGGVDDASDTQKSKSPNSSILKTLGKSMSSAVHTLAPAASITQAKRLGKSRADDVDEMEKGIVSTAAPLDVKIPTTPQPERASDLVEYPNTPVVSRPGIAAPASTPATKSPLTFGMTLPSPPWSRGPILPIHTGDAVGDSNSPRGFVSALKWMLKKTFGYFWQRRQ
ncbi:hypothetical protein CPC08DRAFT_746286 [Agrocybe pediades]|nr:hypothetical protein CPC08DRAFT_746286 [Agrocybe pediades]